ncbi:MAG: hypothetical protein IKZ19_04755, partial [Clostridia bacterium]|nr:hypothetical protein [Clostridia bacterium]
CPVDPKLGIPVATLFEEDVLSYFDTEYHRFIQGACVYNGDIYSVEGFTDSIENPPALRIISPEKQRQKLYLPFSEFGLSEEAEFIDFHNGKCLYSDNRGKLYELEF